MKIRLAFIKYTIVVLMGTCMCLNALVACRTTRLERESGAVAGPSVIRINVTRQHYNPQWPWQKLNPNTDSSIGVIIDDNLVLSTASLLVNHRYIELEKIDSRAKTRARARVIDYEANLALLEPEQADFIKDMPSIAIDSTAAVGDQLAIWQVKPNGSVIPAQAELTLIEVGPYALDHRFLLYRLNGSLQYRSSNISLPVLKNDRLVGFIMRYNTDRQSIDAVCAPIIEHFLTDALHHRDQTKYKGFPSVGMKLAGTSDAQFRRYVGIENHTGGAYVENVIFNGPADQAGIRPGDIILNVAGYPIDSRGMFNHPRYGMLELSHLVRCEAYAGDTVPFQLFRNGRMLNVDVIVDYRAPEDYLSPPYIIDKPIRYYILGGLILQELSAQYLKAWGKEWPLTAPTNLVYYHINQDRFKLDQGQRIVILTDVLPTYYTAGYEKLANLIVTRINGQVITRLEDVPDALQHPVSGFHVIEFDQHPRIIFLDPGELPLIDEQVRQRYRVPILSDLE